MKGRKNGDPDVVDPPRIFRVRKVAGCGKENGLQLVLDNKRLLGLISPAQRRRQSLSQGYRAFVTLPGVVSSKIPFHVDPSYEGEHNFYLHGIHVITVVVPLH